MKQLQKCIFGIFLCTGAVIANCAPPPPPACEEPKPYHCTQGGDWFTRLRALYILPDDSSTSVSTIPHSGVSVHPCWTGELDIAYMLTKQLGLELILGTCRNTLVGKGSLEGTKIGTTWLLPPTLTVQFRPFTDSIVQPYLGAGVNYTLFYGVDCSLPSTDLSLSHSWGPAAQGGCDFFFYEDWLFNLDVKYIWIDTDATLSGGVPGTVSVDINPWVFGFGIGKKW